MAIYTPAGNDTAALQGALNAARAAGGGRIVLEGISYFTDALDATNINDLEIIAEPKTVIVSEQTIPAPMLDLSNSHNFYGENLRFSAPVQAVTPQAAVLVCSSDRTVFERMRMSGVFSSGALCIIAATSVNVRDAQLMNYHPDAPCLTISEHTEWGLQSLFSPIPTGGESVGDIQFFGSEIHSLGTIGQPPFAPWTTHMRHANNVHFYGGIHDNSGSAHMLFQGNCKDIVIATKFYSEMGHPSQALFECTIGASCSKLTVLKAHRSSSNEPNVFIGAGSFPDFWMAPSA